ncbi:CPBP family intramembrane glutamic endopeptidase [Stenotrophomonas sp. MMGLT7]|uniref:CPBP family intramembrane glutamic endopeptidase n=1 Tax=Stenotrophomonas sp. MMGLT7 TaxID=2901227 RepID=UPI001E5B9003|nr:CPBP family intramembrane glutamic endopeptidase [Stenotrophomonas sp. MMGLT7]MCD7098495.1 CPBP family intramembrane metalloprotease [Stenotrophomonas sp. MMGLT7]
MTPAPVAASSPNRSAPAPLRSLLLAFASDALIAAGVLVLASLAAMLAWGLYRGFELARQARAGGAAPVAEAIVSQVGQPGALGQMLIALAGTSMAALVLYFWRRPASAEERARSRQAWRQSSTWGWTLLVALAVFVGSSAIASFFERFGIKPLPTNLAMVKEALLHWPAFLVLFAVVLAPAYEELLFRRVLFGRFLAAGRPWLGLLLSSVAFALMHEIPGLSGNGPAAICQLWLIYGGMGAAFAWLYWRTGSLWAPILAHALNNATALVAMRWFGAN